MSKRKPNIILLAAYIFLLLIEILSFRFPGLFPIIYHNGAKFVGVSDFYVNIFCLCEGLFIILYLNALGEKLCFSINKAIGIFLVVIRLITLLVKLMDNDASGCVINIVIIVLTIFIVKDQKDLKAYENAQKKSRRKQILKSIILLAIISINIIYVFIPKRFVYIFIDSFEEDTVTYEADKNILSEIAPVSFILTGPASGWKFYANSSGKVEVTVYDVPNFEFVDTTVEKYEFNVDDNLYIYSDNFDWDYIKLAYTFNLYIITLCLLLLFLMTTNNIINRNTKLHEDCFQTNKGS